MKMNKIFEATDNRLHCTVGRERINKGEKYFRDAQQGYRNSHTVNICRMCVARMFVEFDIKDDELSQIKKEIILTRL